ncbi:M14 family metallocarboxypeptidase [Pelagicoccus sp. SDUM812002]|uniref:M14 family metallopeptidase n=1 Tax=Pelagicoccus sp. SDUM812002 TaxID=3041266 RepID=UPI00280D118F|nr:M14 family metallocarboxypeptidase [Pelagicoccus sp. SDUM812002]MDQ8185613.1 M14 family metallocarboxypeptidase [Pelagicoccus sp. SDUM812002]
MIQPEPFSASLIELSERRGFQLRTIGTVSKHSIYALSRNSASASQRPYRIYISSGIHGDEPAGPLTIAHLLEEDLLPYDCDITLIPLINPTGFEARTRENAIGHDLNRDFRYPKNPESEAVKLFLEQIDPFDLSLALHEDWESTGFYLYAIVANADTSKAQEILDTIEKIGPLDLALEIDGSAATAGLISRPADFDIYERDDWPEAFLLYSKSRHAHYTLETPSSAPLEQRVAEHTAAVLRAIELHRV